MFLYIVVDATNWSIVCNEPLSYEVAKELRDDLQWFADMAEDTTRYAIAQCITD